MNTGHKIWMGVCIGLSIVIGLVCLMDTRSPTCSLIAAMFSFWMFFGRDYVGAKLLRGVARGGGREQQDERETGPGPQEAPPGQR